MTIKSPFKFLDSYNREDKDIFFGRKKEIEDVYTKVFLSKILLVYGQSGTGKSSLVNCGLANKFVEADWLPIHIRRNQGIAESSLEQLHKMAITPIKQNGKADFVKNLKKFTQSIYLDYFKPIYFIFDQFEELFIFGSQEEWSEFIEGIHQLSLSDLNVHFIFIIRAEYLHQLSVFEETIPEFFDNRVRVEKMTRKNALECIEGPCKVYDIDFDDDFAENLLFQLSPDTTEIELTYLQVFLDKVYRKSQPKSDEDKIAFTNATLNDIGLVSDVLAEYLDEQSNEITGDDKPQTLLKAFVSKDGTKRQITPKDTVDFASSIDKVIEEKEAENIIQELVNRRILKEQNEDGRYELRHDALAAKIFDKITLEERELIEARQFIEYAYAEHDKRGFMLNESDLAYITPHKFKLNLPKEFIEFINKSDKLVRKKKRNRKRIIGTIVVITILLITSVIGLFYAQQQREAALEQQMLAEQSAAEAEAQKEFAEQNAQVAEEQRLLADSSADQAARQAEIAQLQKLLAEEQKNQADSNRLEAERQRLFALIQKDSAEIQRLRAEQFAEEANDLRSQAITLQMQLLAKSVAIKAAQLPDAIQKALLARQAYNYNQSFKGYAYEADIYRSLYAAQKSNSSDEFNVIKGHTAAVRKLLVANQVVYSTGSDGKILAWSLKAGKTNSKVIAETGQIINTMAINSSGRFLATGGSNSIVTIFELPQGKLIKTIRAHSGEVWHLQFTPEDRLLSSGGDQTIKQWDLNQDSNTIVVTAETNVHAFDYLPSGHLVAGLENGKVLSYSSANDTTPIELFEQTGDPVTVITSSNDDKFIAVGFESGSIQMWGVDNQNIEQTLAGHTAHVADIKFSSNDRFLITGGYDRKNLLWNLRHIKEQPIVWDDHASFVLAVSFTPGGRSIITGELNGTMKLYEIEMGRYASQMCGFVDRNLTQQEWNSFIGEQFSYQNTCKSLSP